MQRRGGLTAHLTCMTRLGETCSSTNVCINYSWKMLNRPRYCLSINSWVKRRQHKVLLEKRAIKTSFPNESDCKSIHSSEEQSHFRVTHLMKETYLLKCQPRHTCIFNAAYLSAFPPLIHQDKAKWCLIDAKMKEQTGPLLSSPESSVWTLTWIRFTGCIASLSN